MATTKTGQELLAMSEEFTTKKFSRKDIVREVQNAIPRIEKEAVTNHLKDRRVYRIEDEDAADCEWETFIVGSICSNDATKVIIEGKDFHWAHLCKMHADAWINANQDQVH